MGFDEEFDWRTSLDTFSQQLLGEANIVSPPIDAFLLAERLGATVVIDQQQESRGRTKRLMGRSTIVLRPEELPERMQWAAAHEVAESRLWDWAERNQIHPQDWPENQREFFANQMASRLLLPARWFHRDSAEFSHDLFRLKERYASASHELIALRWLDLTIGSHLIVTILDQGNITRRLSNDARGWLSLHPNEKSCWLAVHDSGEFQSMQTASMRILGWPVHLPEWKREILRTEIDPEFEEMPVDS